jgi:hypothetical protein
MKYKSNIVKVRKPPSTDRYFKNETWKKNKEKKRLKQLKKEANDKSKNC